MFFLFFTVSMQRLLSWNAKAALAYASEPIHLKEWNFE